MKKFTVLDVFCGAGGLSFGFSQAGFKILGGIDSDPQAMKTYSLNFPKSKAVVADLSSVKAAGLSKLIDGSNVDVMVGGPPCQGFSIAGKRLESDPRNILYREYLRIVRFLKPRALLIENVPNILTMFEGRVASAIYDDLERIGYDVHVSKVNSADFGVPQLRNRAFFVAIKRGEGKYKFPLPSTPSRDLNCADAISDLPTPDIGLFENAVPYGQDTNNQYQLLMREGSNAVHNHWAVAHKERTIEIIAMVPDGGNYKCLPKDLWSTRKVNIAWTRMDSSRPCFTIDAGHNHHFHYSANRVPTVRESARIQSFSDRFIFQGTRTSQFRQVGNAVPPLVAKALGEALKRAIS